MKSLSVVVIAGCLLIGSAKAQNIDLSNRVATVSTLDGKTLDKVILAYGNLDGIIWRSDASGGLIRYTNLSLEALTSLGIPEDRIELSRRRAVLKALADARFNSEKAEALAAEQRRQAAEQAKWAAEAPKRQMEAERQADLQRIQVLSARIEAERDRLKRQAAAVHDFNMAHLNDDTPLVYQKESAHVAVDDAQKQLDKMRADYEAKHGAGK